MVSGESFGPCSSSIFFLLRDTLYSGQEGGYIFLAAKGCGSLKALYSTTQAFGQRETLAAARKKA
jgi:hypothetical protein